jgi:hypothetical protein
MQSDSVTERSHGYDVWFAEECTWTARVTQPALTELYPGEKGPFSIFDCWWNKKILLFAKKCSPFAEKSVFTTRPLQQGSCSRARSSHSPHSQRVPCHLHGGLPPCLRPAQPCSKIQVTLSASRWANTSVEAEFHPIFFGCQVTFLPCMTLSVFGTLLQWAVLFALAHPQDSGLGLHLHGNRVTVPSAGGRGLPLPQQRPGIQPLCVTPGYNQGPRRRLLRTLHSSSATRAPTTGQLPSPAASSVGHSWLHTPCHVLH